MTQGCKYIYCLTAEVNGKETPMVSAYWKFAIRKAKNSYDSNGWKNTKVYRVNRKTFEGPVIWDLNTIRQFLEEVTF